MLERHKLLMGRTQDRVGQNNGSIGVFWRSFNGIIGHIRYMQIDGGYAHQSEDPARHRRAACGGSLAAVFGRRAVMVRALWDDVHAAENF